VAIKAGFRYFKAPSGTVHAVQTKEDGTLHTVLFETGPHAVMYTFNRLRPIAFQIEKIFFPIDQFEDTFTPLNSEHAQAAAPLLVQLLA
jgi:hypothetical protein